MQTETPHYSDDLHEVQVIECWVNGQGRNRAGIYLLSPSTAETIEYLRIDKTKVRDGFVVDRMNRYSFERWIKDYNCKRVM